MTQLKVYVSTFGKYNAGILFGQWMNLNDYSSKEEFLAAARDLHYDEENPELFFQESENLPMYVLTETSIDWRYVEVFNDIDESKIDALNAFVDAFDGRELDTFEQRYLGQAESREDYAIQHVEEHGLLNDVPENVARYFDYDAYARDLFINNLVFKDGYIFSNQ